jgi:hypothetical protein
MDIWHFYINDKLNIVGFTEQLILTERTINKTYFNKFLKSKIEIIPEHWVLLNFGLKYGFATKEHLRDSFDFYRTINNQQYKLIKINKNLYKLKTL